MFVRQSLHSLLLALLFWAMTCTLGQPAQAAAGATFSYQVPADCRVTLAIDNTDGRRVRNLMSDTPVIAGTHTATWDGLDDNGKPGTYHWKGLTRGDFHLIYRGAFTHGDPPWQYGKTGGWLADHYAPCAILSYKNSMLIGSGVAENGHGLVSCDLEGHKQWGITWLSGAAWQGVASEATDGERVFATGFSGWGDNWVWEVNPETGDSWPIVRIGHDADANAKPPIPDRPAPFEGPMGLRVVGARRLGATRWDGELFVSDIFSKQPRTFVFSTQRAPEASPGDTRGYYNGGINKWYTLKLLRTLPIKTWGLTWLPDGRCIAVLDRSLAVLNPATGATTPLVTQGLEAPYAITSDAAGRIFVSDRGGQREWDNPAASIRQTGQRTSAKASMQVKVFDASGHYLTAIGHEGGQGAGLLDSGALDLPGGVAVDAQGHVWITEETATKRVSVWDVPSQPNGGSPKLLREFFGPGAYGEGAYMLDPAHPGLLTSGTNKITWNIDLAKQTYGPVFIPTKVETPGLWNSRRFLPDFPFGESYESADGSNWFKFTHDTFTASGKTYTWYGDAVGAFGVIGLKTPGPNIKPLAAFGAVRNYIMAAGRYSGQWVPQAIIEAAKKLPNWPALAAKGGLNPDMTDLPHEPGAWGKWPVELNFFNWTDTNSDGLMQSGEVALHPLNAQHGAHLVNVDHQLNALVSVYGKLFRMRPTTINTLGLPTYDWAQAETASLDAVGEPAAVLDDGSQLIAVPEDDVIRYVEADMKQRWSYPSLYHGHNHRGMDNQRERVKAPGAVYGAWNLQGVVPGPSELGSFFMLHSGMGTNYLLSRDGLFIASLFKSVYDSDGLSWANVPTAKPGMVLDNYTLGDECFNVSIAMAEKTEDGFEQGHYYLLGLGRRVVVELTGLETVHRLSGQTLELQPEVVNEKTRSVLDALAEKWRQQEQDSLASIPYADRFDRSLLENSVRERLPNHARVAMWHNERGLGISALLDYTQGTPPGQVFTNPAPTWERDFAYGDTLDLVLGPETGATNSFDRQRICFCERDGKVETVRYRWMNAADAPTGSRVLSEGRKGAQAWVAELLPLSDATVQRFDPENWTTHAIFEATLPWSVLGATYSTGMKLRGDVGYAKRLPGGTGVNRQYAVSDVGTTSYDLNTALALHDNLWRTYVLGPKGYVMPPTVDTAHALTKGETLALDYRRPQAPPVISFGGAKTQISANAQGLNLKWQVTGDNSPLANGGTDWTMLFKTGDACDLQIDSPTLGKCRYLLSSFEGKPVVVRYRFDAKDALPTQGVKFQAGAGNFFVPIVEQLPIQPQIGRGKDWYTLDVSLPWTMLGIVPAPNMRIATELGVLRSDDSGSATISRTYWNSGLRGMVVDTPTEAKPTSNWGLLLLK